jgi:hypothetical protein
VGALHIPGRTFHVDQFYLEDLIEARLRTALAAEAAGKAAAAQGGPDSSGYGDYDHYGYEPASFAAYLNSSNGGALGASAAAARAARRSGEMPSEARVAVGAGNPKFPPTWRDFDRDLKGYSVRSLGTPIRWRFLCCVQASGVYAKLECIVLAGSLQHCLLMHLFLCISAAEHQDCLERLWLVTICCSRALLHATQVNTRTRQIHVTRSMCLLRCCTASLLKMKA